MAEIQRYWISHPLSQRLTYLVGRSLMLGHTLCILAALCGRQLCYPHLPITGTHGQGGITTVRKKLGLVVKNKKKVIQEIEVNFERKKCDDNPNSPPFVTQQLEI